MEVKPQFNKEEYYVTPFREVRSVDEYGRVGYLPVERSMKTTGIILLDALLEELQTGSLKLTSYCQRYGVTAAEANTLCRLFFGCTREDLRYYFLLRKADELLRYTNLPISEVAERSGLGTHVNLCYTFRRWYKCTPQERRDMLREKGDLNRYRL